MKPTDKNLAKHIGTSTQTLHNWKTNPNEAIQRRYSILKNHFIEHCKQAYNYDTEQNSKKG